MTDDGETMNETLWTMQGHQTNNEFHDSKPDHLFSKKRTWTIENDIAESSISIGNELLWGFRNDTYRIGTKASSRHKLEAGVAKDLSQNECYDSLLALSPKGPSCAIANSLFTMEDSEDTANSEFPGTENIDTHGLSVYEESDTKLYLSKNSDGGLPLCNGSSDFEESNTMVHLLRNSNTDDPHSMTNKDVSCLEQHEIDPYHSCLHMKQDSNDMGAFPGQLPAVVKTEDTGTGYYDSENGLSALSGLGKRNLDSYSFSELLNADLVVTYEELDACLLDRFPYNCNSSIDRSLGQEAGALDGELDDQELQLFPSLVMPPIFDLPFQESSLQSNLVKNIGVHTSVNTQMCSVVSDIMDDKAIQPLGFPNKILDLIISKKIASINFPSTISELLSTGLLDGFPVKYIKGKKNVNMLCGKVAGDGILCSCTSCNGCKVVSAGEFELHAGCSSRNPAANIFLEGGNTLSDVHQAVKSTPVNLLSEVLQWVNNSNGNLSTLLGSEELFSPPIQRVSEACGNCDTVEQSQAADQYHLDLCPPSGANMIIFPQGPTSSATQQERAKERKLVPKRDTSLHKALFSEKGLADGTKLVYHATTTQIVLEGYKKGNGIVCNCCGKLVSPSKFEAHAGYASRRQPYIHIFASGRSLHDHSISISRSQMPSATTGSDHCHFCGNGGELLFCDECSRSIHKGCLELQFVSKENHFCPFCSGKSEPRRKLASRRPSLASSRNQSAQTSKLTHKNRIKSLPFEVGGCVICRDFDFTKGGFDARTVMICDQCEREYHVGCLKDQGICDLKELPEGKWFCCVDCSMIHVTLQKLITNRAEMLSDSLLDIIKRKHEEKGLTMDSETGMQWQLLSGKAWHLNDGCLLSKANTMFHECFGPLLEQTGCDLISCMVEGKQMGDREYGGFYCAVLTVNSAIASAGLLRIFGQEVAELPLVATCNDSRGYGYFRCLFLCIEKLLISLNVKKLILPATEDAQSIWIEKFGFRKISKEKVNSYTEVFPIMIFKGTSMLEKQFVNFEIS
ncbi:hypothetical protein AMTRI_Chr08g204640 [Amborella trichopoda]